MTLWQPSRLAAAAFLLAVPIALANCSRLVFALANAPAYVGSFGRHAGIPYGADPRQSLDIYVPDGGKRRPVIVFWHGGTWIKGSKEQYRFVGSALASAGYVAVLPNYRLVPQARFPQFIEDGALAVKWTREHAAEFGGDPDAIFLMGHSAGAHISATLGLDEQYLRRVGGHLGWVRGWIGLSGPYSLDTSFPPLLGEIFRAPYDERDWRPVALVSADSRPALLLHGTDDFVVHPREAVDLERHLHEAGAPVECHLYPGASHWDTVAAFSLPSRNTAPSLADVRRFVESTISSAKGQAAAGARCPALRLRRDWTPGTPAGFNGR